MTLENHPLRSFLDRHEAYGERDLVPSDYARVLNEVVDDICSNRIVAAVESGELLRPESSFEGESVLVSQALVFFVRSIAISTHVSGNREFTDELEVSHDFRPAHGLLLETVSVWQPDDGDGRQRTSLHCLGSNDHRRVFSVWSADSVGREFWRGTEASARRHLIDTENDNDDNDDDNDDGDEESESL